jgi:hypothetical protein
VQFGTVVKMSYDTKQEFVVHTSNHLSHRFHLAYSASCYQSQLFDDIGFMGDTDCSQQILERTYEYPPDTNIWTKTILQEAQHTFSQMSGTEIVTTITTKDFQDSWQCVYERTSSSFSSITFLNYKAFASHSMLSAIQQPLI